MDAFHSKNDTTHSNRLGFKNESIFRLNSSMIIRNFEERIMDFDDDNMCAKSRL
ncbi:hypothetical protein CPB86DRAFT_789452 [Serendipita vermifera]|nr:hypothetical protein CPB86DRAFT_789452 [Serendipita vermifera]